MGEFKAGEVVVPVIPDASDFFKRLKKDLFAGATGIGREIGQEIGRGIKDGLGDPLAPLKDQTQRQKTQAPKDGDAIGGAFARGFKTRLEAAFKSLPKASIDADSSPAEAKLAELRARLAELSGKTVGVDIDAAAALGEVAAIQRELSALDGKKVSADVRVDIASALAELTAVRAEVDALDGKKATAKVDVDVSGALGAVGILSAALAGLAAIPVAAGIGAGLASLAGPIAAAGAGFGSFAAVAIPSVTRITEALKEQDKATQKAAGSTSSAAQTAAQAAQQALQLEQGERAVTDAKKAARQAEEDLTQARKDARQAIEDLTRSVKDAALSEEDAALSVEEARQRLAEVIANPKSTDLEKRRAELNYREAVQHLDDQKARTKQVKDQQSQADKAGIEGSKQVKAAKDKLAQANQKVKDSEAQLKVLRLQQAAAAAKEAQATGGIVSKLSKLSPAAQAAAKSIRSSQKAYLDWQKSLEPNVLPVITDGLKILTSQLPKLSPIVRGSSVALLGLERDAKKALGGPFWTDFFQQIGSAAPHAIYGLGKAGGSVFTGLAGIVKAFLPYVDDVVGAIQRAATVFANWGKGLGSSSGFQAFIAYAQQNGPKVVQIIKDLFTVIGNLLTGLSGSGAGALDVVVKIADWLASLSPETLRNFVLAALAAVTAFKSWKLITTVVDGVKKSIETTKTIISGAKTVWSGLGSAASLGAKGVKAAASGIASAVSGIGNGASKAGSAAWTGIQTAASKAGSAAKVAGSAIFNAGKTAATAAVGLGKVAFEYAAIAVKAAIARAGQVLYAVAQGIVKAATIAWTAVQWLLNAALNANPIGLIVLAITALVGALIWAWNNSQTFRDIVMAVWTAISTAVQWAWTNVIKPALDAMVLLWQTVLAPALTWLWQTIFKPAWDAIAAAVTWAWQNVIKPHLDAMVLLWRTVIGPALTWLWQNVFKPGFAAMGLLVKTAWETVIKPALDAMVNLWKNVIGPAVTWLWKTIIVPAWDGIKNTIKAAWDNFIKPTLQGLYDFIFKTIPDAFTKGVGLIETAWNKVKDIAKKPVEFIVNTVYTGGIKKVWDAVAKVLGLPALPDVKFAKGGIYPGYTPGRDVGLAAVSGGEAIMRPEWTRAVGENYVHKMNSTARQGGVAGVARALGVAGDPGPGFAGAFADGGIVGNIQEALAGGLKIGAEKLLNPLLDRASAALGDTGWAKMLVGIPKTLVKHLIDFIGKKEGSGGTAVQFARAQIGKPYQWGATGPGSFDCSGLTMRAWQAAGVKDIPRTSEQQIGWVKPVASPLPGDLGFPHSGHVWLYSGNNKIIEAAHSGTNVREVAARAAQVMGRPPSQFANGGIVRMAAGGVRPAANIASSPTVLYGEAGPEAYIPLSPGKRAASVPILAKAAQQLGFQLVPAGASAVGDYAAMLAKSGLVSANAGGSVVGVSAVQSTASRSVAATVQASSATISSSLSSTARSVVYALGDTSTRVASSLSTTSSTVSSALTGAAGTVSTSLNTAATAAAGQISTATGDLSATISQQLTAIQDTLKQLVTAVQSAGTATAAKSAAASSKSSTAKAAAKTKTGSKATLKNVVAPVLNSTLIAPEATAAAAPGAYSHYGTSFDSSLTASAPTSTQDMQGTSTSAGAASLVTVQTMNVTPDQSPYAIAQDLQYLLGAKLRMK